MRSKASGLAAILILSLGLGGCAAAAGSVAGNVIGGAAWGAVKGGKLAWKGGSFVGKTAGRTVVGAARGVHEEFSGSRGSDKGDRAPVQTASAEQARTAPASTHGEGAALPD